MAISIHVPRERDDLPIRNDGFSDQISIHVPRERDDPRAGQAARWVSRVFQSTSLVRGTTTFLRLSLISLIFQSTSLVRGTTFVSAPSDKLLRFQSTSLVRGTTKQNVHSTANQGISIHVPRERDDAPQGRVLVLIPLISIHVPRERDDQRCTRCHASQNNFNPRPS